MRSKPVIVVEFTFNRRGGKEFPGRRLLGRALTVRLSDAARFDRIFGGGETTGLTEMAEADGATGCSFATSCTPSLVFWLDLPSFLRSTGGGAACAVTAEAAGPPCGSKRMAPAAITAAARSMAKLPM